MRISVIVPTYDEERDIAATIASAAAADEIIVVDGGSADATCAVAARAGAKVLVGERGRGRQLGYGARMATGDVLVFLHADTRLPPSFADDVRRALGAGRALWGRFDVRLDDDSWILRAIGRLISLRSRLTRIATGDQAIFVRRDVYEAVGGIREPELFEDIDLSRRLRAYGRAAALRSCVVTSARRWRTRGVWRTSFLMWGLKLAYLAGVPSARLARFYADVRERDAARPISETEAEEGG